MSNTDSTTEGTTTTTTVKYEKGTWQESLDKSATLLDRSAKAKKTATNLLWAGAKAGIGEWMPSSATDVNGEAFYNEVVAILGTSRKGDASKIKTVALAVRNNALDLASYPNLSQAYAEATRLTKTVRQQAEEDSAAEEAIASIEAPKTATTQESAAALLLSKGIDGAVVAILDALGKTNFEAHRSFIRAVSTEVSSRVQAAKPKPEPKPVKEKTVKAAKPAAKKAAPKAAATKAKPAAAKAKPVKVEVEDEGVVEDSTTETAAPATTAKPVRRAVPVKRAAK